MSLQTIGLQLAPLCSVLRIPADYHAPVRTLHLSFAKYLLGDKARDYPFVIDGPGTHFTLSRHCSKVLSGPGSIRENICDLQYPGQQRDEIETATISNQLSLVTQYACRYWVRNVQASLHQTQDVGEVYVFLKEHFLHWLETLSWMDLISEATSLVSSLQSCVSARAVNVPAFLEDTRRFVLANRSIMDLAPLQLYSSAIIFAPQHSLVRTICGQVLLWIQQHTETPEDWGPELQQLEEHSSMVIAVAFSPDGRLLVSVSDGKTIRLWDTQTDREVQKLEGHSEAVLAVAFSPSSDDNLLASSSSDWTIRLWDKLTGKEIRKLERHKVYWWYRPV